MGKRMPGVEAAKRQITKELKKAGLWRDDVPPQWEVTGDLVSCWFPNTWDVPVNSSNARKEP
jgi:hypothetical protein